MKNNNRKTNFYTLGRQRTARALLIVWLLGSCSLGSVLAKDGAIGPMKVALHALLMMSSLVPGNSLKLHQEGSGLTGSGVNSTDMASDLAATLSQMVSQEVSDAVNSGEDIEIDLDAGIADDSGGGNGFGDLSEEEQREVIIKADQALKCEKNPNQAITIRHVRLEAIPGDEELQSGRIVIESETDNTASRTRPTQKVILRCKNQDRSLEFQSS